MAEKFFLPKSIGNQVLMIGVSKTTYGGMAAVLASYEKYFEKKRFIPTWKLGNRFVKSSFAFQAIIRCFLLMLFDRRIKLLHIHGAANASFYRKKIFIKMGKAFGKKIIMHQHAADFKEFFEHSNDKKSICATLNSCDILIVLSQSWKRYFADIGVSETKIKVLNNIVTPPATYSPKQAGNKLHLLFLGEISNRKGIYDLLEVLKQDPAMFLGKIFLRIGGNRVDGDINAFIAENDLSQLCRYEGWISGEKKRECLEWADIYILPSYNEGLPIAILEAMSYAHPVISTHVGGIPEILHHHKNGILIAPGEKAQIKNALLFFMENPKKIAEYGKNAYQNVQPFFPGNVLAHLEQIYKKLLKN